MQQHNNIPLAKACLINIKSHFIFKDNNIWVFGAIRGEKYMDNAKYLFEYVNQYTDVTAVWLSNNAKVIEQVKAKGYTAFLMHSSEATKYALRAKIAVITHRGSNKKADLPFYAFTKKTKVIQLWHGMPLKKIAYDDKIYSFTHNEASYKYKLKEAIKKVFFPFTQYVNQPSLIISLSGESRNIIAQAFRIDKSKVVATGFPRNNLLNKNTNNIASTNKILYAPTFRDTEGAKFNLFKDYMFNTKNIDLFLEQHNAQLHIKLHPFNLPPTPIANEIRNSRNIVILKTDDIYEKLNSYSILITDYSSIFFDFLLTEKPIIFAPFDQDQYLKNDREFYYDYDNITPGPHAKDWIVILDYLNNFFLGNDDYKEKRNKIKHEFHDHTKNEYSQNVLHEIKKLINEK